MLSGFSVVFDVVLKVVCNLKRQTIKFLVIGSRPSV